MKDGKSAQFHEAAERGMVWIASKQRPDGSFCDVEDGVGSYYKILYAQALFGRLGEANALTDWVAEHHFTAEGDFRAAQRKAREPFHEAWPVYSNAWLVQAAHRIGRWDLSLPGAKFILRYQTPAGGFYALDDQKPHLETACTSWGALAELATGDLESARRAGDLLVRLVESQPDAERFYFRMDMEGNLATDVPPGGELNYYVDATRPKQIYFYPGIAMIFLGHLYRATGEQNYLDASRRIFGFTERCAEDVHRFPPSGKLGLGCALLYAVTGDSNARQSAIHVGEYLAETQTADGFWRLPDEEPYLELADKDGIEILLDVTAEFTTFLMEIAALLR